MQVERREISRVQVKRKAVIVLCDTLKKIEAEAIDFSPIGIGLKIAGDVEDISGKDVIVVTDTLIMYADVIRQAKRDDGVQIVGVAGKQFTEDVMQYLFDCIAPEE